MRKFKKGPHKSIFDEKFKNKITSSRDLDSDVFIMSFKHFDKNQGDSLQKWELNSKLSKALEVIFNYSQKPLRVQFGKNFKIYGSFPPKNKTEFYHPVHVPEDAEWASLHVDGLSCLIGHIFQNIFYLVFLDGEHLFWKSEKKHT